MNSDCRHHCLLGAISSTALLRHQLTAYGRTQHEKPGGRRRNESGETPAMGEKHKEQESAIP